MTEKTQHELIIAEMNRLNTLERLNTTLVSKRYPHFEKVTKEREAMLDGSYFADYPKRLSDHELCKK